MTEDPSNVWRAPVPPDGRAELTSRVVFRVDRERLDRLALGVYRWRIAGVLALGVLGAALLAIGHLAVGVGVILAALCSWYALVRPVWTGIRAWIRTVGLTWSGDPITAEVTAHAVRWSSPTAELTVPLRAVTEVGEVVLLWTDSRHFFPVDGRTVVEGDIVAFAAAARAHVARMQSPIVAVG